MMAPKATGNHAYKFQRIFTDGDFLAAGVLAIPPGESKPLKPARDNTYVGSTASFPHRMWAAADCLAYLASCSGC